jgi:hypothetical protein
MHRSSEILLRTAQPGDPGSHSGLYLSGIGLSLQRPAPCALRDALLWVTTQAYHGHEAGNSRIGSFLLDTSYPQ